MPPGLPPDAPEPSYLPQRQGRTKILLSGTEPLVVLENAGNVLGQLEEEWVVVRVDEEHSAHIRSEDVVGIVDLSHHEPLRAA